MKYIIISSAYNEEQYIEKTLASVIKQTKLPKIWIIINDGSTDSTKNIIEKYSLKYLWIKAVNKTKGNWDFGTHAVKNFEYGLSLVNMNDYDFIVKLDTDLDILREDYFEYQIKEFEKSKRLGITSGITFYINRHGEKKLVNHPVWRTTGALKMYRKECLWDIGGLIPIYGWDGIDDYKAMYRNWDTRTFFGLEVNHLAKSRDQVRQTNPELFYQKGKSYYLRGYSELFILLKAFSLLVKTNYSFFSNLLKGYFESKKNGIEKIITKEEQKFIRSYQVKRVLGLTK